MKAFASSVGQFLKRLAIAGINLLVPLHTGLITGYFVMRWLGWGDLWFVDALAFVLPWLFAPLVVLWPGVLLLRRTRFFVALAVVPTALFLLTYGRLYLPRWPVRADDPAFTAMAYNILYQNADANGIVAAIEAQSPDLIGLHELQGPMAETLEARLTDRYPYYRVDPWCGFFSRYPILRYETLPYENSSRVMGQQVTLDIDGHQVNVLSIHPRSPPFHRKHVPFLGLTLGIPTGFDNRDRDAELRAVLECVAALDGPVVVIGDFNLSDQQEMYRLLTNHLRDAHQEAGWGMGFTWTNYRNLGLPMWRIDYVLHSPDLVALSAETGDFGGSDHRPMIARLAFRKDGREP